MQPWLQAAIAWMRRQIAWSNSRRSWQERIGFLALAGTLVGGWFISRSWDFELRIVLLAAWLVLLAILLRRGLVKLFGPVFFFEALRGTRKRIHLFRTLYALALLFAISWVWIGHSDSGGFRRGELKAQAEFAQTIFLVFYSVQMLVIFFLTPVAVASAIAEEKERRTLEFVLATDLRGREILFGKLAGRMANMTLYLLAGLPILALLQLLGGIDPELLLASIGVAAITFLGLAAISILMSVLQRRSREAIVLTFLVVVAYQALSGASYALLEIPFVRAWSISVSGSTVTSHHVINWFNSGNFIVQLLDVVKAVEFGGVGFHDVLAEVLQNYAIFHAVVIGICLTWATVRLRPVAKAQMSGGATRRDKKGQRHPPIGRWPMMWKEIFADSPRMHWVQKVILALVVIVSFVAPVWITIEFAPKLLTSWPTFTSSFELRWGNPWYWYGRAMNAWVRIVSGFAGTLLLMAVAIRASGSVTGERGKQTFDELLATPLSNDEIVTAKWAGSILSVRRGWIWLLVVFFLGILSGGLNPFGAAATCAAWIVFACVFAEVGLWYSIRARNTFRATTYTLLTCLFLLGGHWLLTLFCCVMPTMGTGMREPDFMEWLACAQLGVTPPATLGMFPIMEFRELEFKDEDFIRVVVFQVVGIFFYLIVALALLRILIYRFGVEFSRTEFRRPERMSTMALRPKLAEEATVLDAKPVDDPSPTPPSGD